MPQNWQVVNYTKTSRYGQGFIFDDFFKSGENLSFLLSFKSYPQFFVLLIIYIYII